MDRENEEELIKEKKRKKHRYEFRNWSKLLLALHATKHFLEHLETS